MALSEAALCLQTEVETELGISAGAEPRLEGWIEDASAMLSQYLRGKEGRLHKQTAIVESLAGDGSPFLVLAVVPINSVTSVAYADDALASTDYEIDDADAGVLYFPAGTINTEMLQGGTVAQPSQVGSGWKLYSVTYNGGWATPRQVELGTLTTPTLPRAIKRAAIELACWLYRNPGGAQQVASESLMSYSVTYDLGSDDDGVDGCGIPRHIRDKVRSFRFLPMQ